MANWRAVAEAALEARLGALLRNAHSTGGAKMTAGATSEEDGGGGGRRGGGKARSQLAS